MEIYSWEQPIPEITIGGRIITSSNNRREDNKSINPADDITAFETNRVSTIIGL